MRYEYLKIDLNGLPKLGDDVALLNDAGREGWRLVMISANSFAYVEREIEKEAPAPAPRRRAAAREAKS
jgi:hypothetical protein